MKRDVKHKKLKGGKEAKKIFAEVTAASATLKSKGWAPSLLSVSVGDEDASDFYIKNQKRIAERCGIAFEHVALPVNITKPELLAKIASHNADPQITGIIIQRPVPAQFDIKEVQQAVHPLKDVEGMHPASLGQVVYNEADLAPCTAKAAVQLLKNTGLTMKGLQVVVVGHSEIVGKPVTHFCCHST